MTDAKSAAERLLESREFCTGWPHPTTNPVRYTFATADVFAVANRCLELEAENAKLREVTWYTWDQVNREIHDGDIWWHDNGDQIFPVNIMWCPTGKYFFASLGQWGWTRSQTLKEMGGFWTPCIEPERQKCE